MNPWYQILEENCYIEHDKFCAKGVECFTRDKHVRSHYIPQALKHRVERLQFENKELRDKIDRVERAFDRHNIEGLLPEYYFRKALDGVDDWWLAYPTGLGYDVTEDCSDCNGVGGSPTDGPCPSCYGQGVLPVTSHKEE